MRFAILIVLFVTVCTPTSASAVTLVNPDGSRAEPYQTWANRARVPVPNLRIVVEQPQWACESTYGPGAKGCARLSEHRIEISRCPSFDSDCWFTFMHELGHFYDHLMPQWKRDVFLSRMGWDGQPWEGDSVLRDPAEHFANAYAYVAVYRTWKSFNRNVEYVGKQDCRPVALSTCLNRRRFNGMVHLLRAPS